MKAENAKWQTIKNLPNNLRFYVLCFTLLISLVAVGILRLTISSDQLFYIRLEQVYGFISVVYLYIALCISPLSKIVGERGSMKQVIFARRAIGVSSAYFATLHISVALWGQIGGLNGLGLLPNRFKISFALGAVAFFILLAMAATSFDKVIKFMTLSRWKWLHRLIYGGLILIILHVWMIGTHVAYTGVQIAAFIALSIFFGLESYRVVLKISSTYQRLQSKRYFVSLLVVSWLFWSGLLYAMPSLVKNYHSENHAEHNTTESTEDHADDSHEESHEQTGHTHE